MKMSFKPVLLATAMLVAGGAHAATESITIGTGASVDSLGTTFSGLTGTGTLQFSELLLGALDIAKIATSAAAPGVVTVDEETGAISAAAPVTALTGTNDSAGTFTATKVNTAGGATMVASKKNVATTTGSLTVTNLTVDLGTQSIYADLIGGNGVGTKSQVKVWNYGSITGSTTVSTATGVHTTNNVLSGLTISSEAFDIFAASLGLTTFGKNSMASIDDYGTISSSITVTTAVPEPSTYAMLASGLAVLAFAAKRARRNNA